MELTPRDKALRLVENRIAKYPTNGMLELLTLKCCAAIEIHGISNYFAFEEIHDLNGTHVGAPAVHAEFFLKKMLPQYFSGESHRYGRRPPFLIFSGHKSYCDPIADFILSNGLGGITKSPERQNWTVKYITLYIWDVDFEKLEKWAKDNNCYTNLKPRDLR